MAELLHIPSILIEYQLSTKPWIIRWWY